LNAAAIEVGLAQRERFVDAKTGPPQHDDQPAQPPAMQAVAGDAHDRDDLLNGARVGWIAQALVARRMTGVKAGHRRRRPSTRTWALPGIRPAAEQKSADRTIKRTSG